MKGRPYCCLHLPDQRTRRRWSQRLLGVACWQGKQQKKQGETWEILMTELWKWLSGYCWGYQLRFYFFFLTMIVVKYWNRLPRNLVVSPLLEVFKTRPSPKEPLFWAGVGLDDLWILQRGKAQSKETTHKRNAVLHYLPTSQRQSGGWLRPCGCCSSVSWSSAKQDVRVEFQGL